MSKRDRDPFIIEALVRNMGHRRAARYAGVCTKTIQRRLQEPEFCLRLHDRMTQVVAERDGERAAALGHAAEKAVAVLIDLMESATLDKDRVKSAVEILDRAGLTKPEPAKKPRNQLPESVNQKSLHEKLDEIRHNQQVARTMDIPERWTKVDKAQVSESTTQPLAGFDPGATLSRQAARTQPGPAPDLRKLPYRQHYLLD